MKWELGIPMLLIICLGSGVASSFDEAAGIVAFYVVIIEFFVYRVVGRTPAGTPEQMNPRKTHFTAVKSLVIAAAAAASSAAAPPSAGP